MSSSRGLTRRRRRRQPLRRCKRFRGNPGGGPFLMDVPEPVLRHILGFTMWDGEKDELKNSLALWKWTGQIGIVCRVFRELARAVAPEKLDVSLAYARRDIDTKVSFLRSFVETPWKKCRLQEFNFTICLDEPDVGGLNTLQRLFESPGSLPNLNRLSLKLWTLNRPPRDMNDFLSNVARSCPNLSELKFDDFPMTPEQLGNFARLLQTPLNKCVLSGDYWVTNAHLDAFLRQQGSDLISLGIEASENVDDSTLDLISTHCSQLQKLTLPFSDITGTRLSSFLQEIGGLTELDVYGCDLYELLAADLMDVLTMHSPQLERFTFLSYLFTDACLERLVQGQIDYWAGRREHIPLFYVDAVFSGVTHTGINRVLAKPNIGHLEIRVWNKNKRRVEVLTEESFPVSQKVVSAALTLEAFEDLIES